VHNAFSGRRTLFLGRKGSGKSALFSQLPRLAEIPGSKDRSVTLLTPDQYSWSALKRYREQGLLDEHAHTNAWKISLAIEISASLLNVEKDWTPAANAALGKMNQFLTDNYGTVSPGLLNTAKSLVKGLQAFNLSAFGFGMGMSRTLPEQGLTPAVAEELLKLCQIALEEHNLILGLDRLDDSWDGTEEARSLLVGLLKATKELNDRFGTSETDSGLRIDVFLRSDIYDDLKFDDKDKHRATEEHILWTPELLREMVERRLPHGVKVDELFEPGEMRGSVAPFDYIVKRTFLRPREVLQFLDECLRKAPRDGIVITKDNVRSAEERYSSWKVADLKQEFSKVFPDFDRLLECLRQGVHRYDNLGELQSVLRLKAADLVEKYGTRLLVETLFECSVIGVRLRDAGSTRFKAEDVDLVLPSEGAVYVHQSVHKGLTIREARRASGEPPVGNPLDRVSIELFSKMLSALPMQDLAFLGTQPMPIAVFENGTFLECARALGTPLIIDEEQKSTETIARPNIISRSRFAMDTRLYAKLRGEMEQLVMSHGYSVDDYVRAERQRLYSSNLDRTCMGLKIEAETKVTIALGWHAGYDRILNSGPLSADLAWSPDLVSSIPVAQ
jgi:hypothetical protein